MTELRPQPAVTPSVKVVIEHVWTEETWVVEGTARQVEAAVLLLFPWLRSPNPADRGDLQVLLEDLGSQQAFMVEIVSTDHRAR